MNDMASIRKMRLESLELCLGFGVATDSWEGARVVPAATVDDFFLGGKP